ncbi:hypothetical protein CANARDRAFT_199076 [[Candida] arabinofermentans NRRL YB-2248]|uniref:FAD dependent oxidoreductase domain-containing protein n=1 Tax=[Candida] arabinofermentans NRRL YB-2248 TaxID=983967 RepID=A0A1E4T0N2_9ASCO|nr:hypothetical protein CANARDRAFT_199076 [[Candida] arabinofermentans NRRL YB-2248]
METDKQQLPDQPELLTYSSFPSGKHKGKIHYIIVGAGIVGVCTAFYLTRHPKFDPEKHFITILESKRVAGGASGKAGGLLALWAFPQQIVPLSFQLHQELANEFNGEDEWGYRRLTTISVEGDINAETKITTEGIDDKPKSTTIKKNSIAIESQTTSTTPNLPTNLKWINRHIIKEWSHLGNESTTAQVHPYQFTTYILKQCIATGSVELVIGKVDDIIVDEDTGDCKGVLYYPSSAKAEYNKKSTEKIELFGDKIIMSIGPWTSKILPDCPISGLRAHSITIQPDSVEKISPYAVFTELKLNRNKFVSPEIYARKDEVYVCGEGDSSVLIPETTDDVEIVAEKCDELFQYVSKISDNLKNGKVLKRQACYLPVLDVPSSSGPLIGETNVENLYLASGHSCWGINNAPATGLLISELLLDGEAKSCDISALDPSLYFDASLVYDDDDDDDDDDDEEGAEEDDEEEGDEDDEEESYDESDSSNESD